MRPYATILNAELKKRRWNSKKNVKIFETDIERWYYILKKQLLELGKNTKTVIK